MRVIFLDTSNEVAQWVSHYIGFHINSFNPTFDNPFILGLPTGNSPITIYNHLIKIYQSNKISFKNAVIFTIDEYLGLPSNDEKSYYAFIHTHFINHIDILKKFLFFLHGNTNNINYECEQYEKKIRSLDKGMNLLIGGVGRNGHIAFNEPGSSLTSCTRIQRLSQETRWSNSKFFNNNINNVPKFALTIGISTLLAAQEVMIIATGRNKSKAVQSAIEGSINHMQTISCLQLHPQGILVCDDQSTMELKVKTVKYFKDLEIDNE